ncbi:MAG: hypothetical protein AMJ94_12825 [Deltaproteobacteria bacterium SM23_61]|nr:MAG: hypothetical protein AMJ94_12825 [Deltaproteobacteria bacterium SM23_61]
MAVIVPFRGISYDPQKINDLSKVVAPPYDVISPQEQDALYQRHPQNVVRLLLNKETPQDNPKDNRYTRSAALYQAWQKEGILARASRPQFYFLQEEFSPSILPPGQTSSTSGKILRQGFIGLIRLEEYSARVVLPHEKTQTKPRADRLALMDACEANFSQIYSLYSDEKGAMGPIYKKVFSSGKPDFDVTDTEGVRRKLWMVSDPGMLKQVREIMKPQEIYIADGHHRYETALAYREGQRKKFPKGTGRETYNFTMMYFAAMEDPGVFILPTHRVVNNLENFTADSFLNQLGSDFSIEAFEFQAGKEKALLDKLLQQLAARSEKERVLGMVMKGLKKYFLLALKDDRSIDRAEPGIAPSLKALDVNLLHLPILKERLNIGAQDLAASKKVIYFKDPGEASAAVQSGEGQIAFFLNPTRTYQVRDVSLAGETMPSKSTFFYPKLLSGLVINPLDPHEEILVE